MFRNASKLRLVAKTKGFAHRDFVQQGDQVRCCVGCPVERSRRLCKPNREFEATVGSGAPRECPNFLPIAGTQSSMDVPWPEVLGRHSFKLSHDHQVHAAIERTASLRKIAGDGMIFSVAARG
jgi:hypothetical protein